MSETFDDLKRLKEMLDAGEVTPEQYETIRAELLADLKADGQQQQRSESAERGPGWYQVPEEPSRQRYWDGTSWTEARQLGAETSLAIQAKASEPRPAYQSPPFIIVSVIGLMVLVGAIIAIAEGDSDPSEIWSALLGLGILAVVGSVIYNNTGKDVDATTINQLPPSVQMAVSQMSPVNQSAFFLEYNQK